MSEQQQQPAQQPDTTTPEQQPAPAQGVEGSTPIYDETIDPAPFEAGDDNAGRLDDDAGDDGARSPGFGVTAKFPNP